MAVGACLYVWQVNGAPWAGRLLHLTCMHWPAIFLQYLLCRCAQRSHPPTAQFPSTPPAHLVLPDQRRQVISHCPVLLHQRAVLRPQPRQLAPQRLGFRPLHLPRPPPAPAAAWRRPPSGPRWRPGPCTHEEHPQEVGPSTIGSKMPLSAHAAECPTRASSHGCKLWHRPPTPHLSASSARWHCTASVPASAAALSARRSSSACSESRSASRAPTTPRSSASSASRCCTAGQYSRQSA